MGGQGAPLDQARRPLHQGPRCSLLLLLLLLHADCLDMGMSLILPGGSLSAWLHSSLEAGLYWD